jgi:2-keto-myo-inositol isomerase
MAWLYCLNTSTIQPASLPEKIKVAAQAGYQAIELWFADIRNYQNTGGSLDDIAKMLQDNGLQVPSMIALHGWMDAHSDAYVQAMRECRELLSIAAKLGCQRVVASPSMRFEAAPLDVDETAKRFSELLKIGHEVGALPMMEFLGFSPKVSRVDQAWEIVKRTGDPDATVVLDPFHLWRGNSSLADVPDLTGERIGIVHFNDVPAGIARELAGDEVRVMPGDGSLPLREFLAEVKRRGYQGALSLELFNRAYWQMNPYEVAKIGLEKMQAIAEAV